MFSSDGQITVGGDDRRLENTRDSRRPPHQKDSPPLILTGRSTRTMDSLSDRLDGRVSKADLLAIIREWDNRPDEARTTSRTAPTWRRDYEIGPPPGQDPRSHKKSTCRYSQGCGGRTGTQSWSRSDEVLGTIASKRGLRPRTQLDKMFKFLPVLYVNVVKISYSVSVTYVEVSYCYDELC